MNIKKLILLYFCFFVSNSCVDDIDFSQIEDYNATPTYSIAALYFKILPVHFFDQFGVQINEISESSEFDFLDDNDDLTEKIVKVEYNVKISNEYGYDFIFQIQLLDANYLPIYTFKEMFVGANNLTYEYNEVIDLVSNPELKNMRVFSLIVKLNNASVTLDPKDLTELQFKSALKAYIDTDA